MKRTGKKKVPGKIPGSSRVIEPCNLKELSALYNISSPTLKKWLLPFEKEIGKKVGYIYTIMQVEKIFAFLGLPSVMDDKTED